jgi:hypothetical protein
LLIKRFSLISFKEFLFIIINSYGCPIKRESS